MITVENCKAHLQKTKEMLFLAVEHKKETSKTELFYSMWFAVHNDDS